PGGLLPADQGVDGSGHRLKGEAAALHLCGRDSPLEFQLLCAFGPDPAEAPLRRPDAHAANGAVSPLKVDDETAARPEPPDAAVLPGARQGRQEVYLPPVRLEEHFGDSRGEPKVAVDLERGMRAQQ